MRLVLTWIGAGANVAAVVGAATEWIPLPPEIEPYRNAIIAVCSLLGVALMYLALGGRFRLRRIQAGRPEIVILGDKEAEALVTAINEQPELKINENISFKAVKPEKRGFSPPARRALELATGVIVTSDFQASTYPIAYDWFVNLRRRHPVPVRRSYPEGFDKSVYNDYQRISHDTPSGIVNYSAEYLLADSVALVGVLTSRSRRAIVYSCVVTVIIAIGLPRISSHFEGISSPPSIVTRERAAGARFAECVSKSTAPMNRAHCTGEYLDDMGKVIDDAIRVALEDQNANEVMLFVQLRTPGVLRGYVLGTDMTAYDVSAPGSIAACAIENNLGVTWLGHDGITQAISGRRINGEKVGTYDAEQRHFSLPKGRACTFQVVSPTDQKHSLHCLAIASDISSPGPAKAALCVSRSAKDNVLSRPELQNYIASLSNLLALADLSVLDTPKPFSPAAAKTPIAKPRAKPSAPSSHY